MKINTWELEISFIPWLLSHDIFCLGFIVAELIFFFPHPDDLGFIKINL